MTEYEIVYSALCDELARFYWQADAARIVTQDVGIDFFYIQWAANPRHFWSNILLWTINATTENENKIRDLLERACADKPDMEVLKDRFLALYVGPGSGV